MIKAAIDITSLMASQMTSDELEDYVRLSLASYLVKEISKTMAITETTNPINDTHTYTTSIPITHTSSNTLTVGTISGSSISTVSGFNGTTRVNTSVQEILRVVEYTKNGKVTRVELQKYDEENDSWSKIPRIQIEE